MTQPTVSLYRDGSTGYWHVNLYWAATRTRIRPSLGTRSDDRAEAEARLSYFIEHELPAITARYEQEPPTPTPKRRSEAGMGPRLSDLCDWYVHTHLPDLGRAQGTIRRYEQVLRDFELHCRGAHIGRVGQLTYERVTAFLDWLAEQRRGRVKGALSPKYRGDVKAVLRALFHAATQAGKLDESPVKNWFIAKTHGTDRPTFALTAAELRECLDTVTLEAPTIANVITFMAHTGTRPSDATDLRWSQVNIEDRYCRRHQIKTSHLATYSLNAAALGAIEAERNRAVSASHVFTNGEGHPWTYNTLYRTFTRALRRAGFLVERDGVVLKVDLKTMRHTYGSIMANMGMPVFLLQRQMGHRRIETTLKYYHEDPAEALRWAERFEAIFSETTENPCPGGVTAKTPRQ